MMDNDKILFSNRKNTFGIVDLTEKQTEIIATVHKEELVKAIKVIDEMCGQQIDIKTAEDSEGDTTLILSERGEEDSGVAIAPIIYPNND